MPAAGLGSDRFQRTSRSIGFRSCSNSTPEPDVASIRRNNGRNREVKQTRQEGMRVLKALALAALIPFSLISPLAAQQDSIPGVTLGRELFRRVEAPDVDVHRACPVRDPVTDLAAADSAKLPLPMGRGVVDRRRALLVGECFQGEGGPDQSRGAGRSLTESTVAVARILRRRLGSETEVPAQAAAADDLSHAWFAQQSSLAMKTPA